MDRSNLLYKEEFFNGGGPMSDLNRMCKICSAPISNTPFMSCGKCLQDQEKVLSYLRKTPLATIQQIAKETGVSVDKITKMIHLGSLKMKV